MFLNIPLLGKLKCTKDAAFFSLKRVIKMIHQIAGNDSYTGYYYYSVSGALFMNK